MHDELRIFVPSHGCGQDESCECLRYPAIWVGRFGQVSTAQRFAVAGNRRGLQPSSACRQRRRCKDVTSYVSTPAAADSLLFRRVRVGDFLMAKGQAGGAVAEGGSSVRWLIASLAGAFAFVSYVQRMN